MNKILLIGNLGRDAELKYTPNGFAISNFSIATSKKTKAGSVTTWHNCKIIGARAETLTQYLKKGKQVYVEGELEKRQWDDKTTGQKREAVDVLVGDLQFLDKFTQDMSTGNPEVESAKKPLVDVPRMEMTEQDIPF